MTKRYRESVQVQTEICVQFDACPAPTVFVWRGGRYRVLAVLGHWREDAAYWSGGVEVPQRDLWRVEAQNGTPARGIYELVAEGPIDGDQIWRLDRIWD
ncbi:MAG: DUF6504 family protein [Euzebya sp.]